MFALLSQGHLHWLGHSSASRMAESQKTSFKASSPQAPDLLAGQCFNSRTFVNEISGLATLTQLTWKPQPQTKMPRSLPSRPVLKCEREGDGTSTKRRVSTGDSRISATSHEFSTFELNQFLVLPMLFCTRFGWVLDYQ